jgi:hypothetical protein
MVAHVDAECPSLSGTCTTSTPFTLPRSRAPPPPNSLNPRPKIQVPRAPNCRGQLPAFEATVSASVSSVPSPFHQWWILGQILLPGDVALRFVRVLFVYSLIYSFINGCIVLCWALASGHYLDRGFRCSPQHL